MTSYCEFVATLIPGTQNPNKYYHDHVYGFPIMNDNELFKRLILEINQAGLSWTLILKREAEFNQAYLGFEIKKVAQFNERDIQKLLANPGIIRNKLKVRAAVYNANQILLLQQQFGSFYQWLSNHQSLTLNEWVKLFKQQFKFTGKEIVREFLLSIGFIKGAHIETCPTYQNILQCHPIWLKNIE